MRKRSRSTPARTTAIGSSIASCARWRPTGTRSTRRAGSSCRPTTSSCVTCIPRTVRRRARAKMGRRGQTLYDVLGVGPTASAAEIRTAYHNLAARYHPDHHDGNTLADLATEKLASINAAYEVLSDPERRAAYDAELGQSSRQPGPRPRAEVVLVR